MTDLLVVVGARPNFMKAASILSAADAAGLTFAVVHTGQHYDAELSAVFFEELGLPEPDVYLGVGSGSHSSQTAEIMLGFEGQLPRIRPSIVVVVGDVNSTLACALVAIKERYPVAHVEAGLRCYDQWMPEEINRRLCDHLATHLFTTSRDADENLRGEGIPSERIMFVGNTMIDTLLRFRDAARARKAPERFGVSERDYSIATLHRPENVDHPETLLGLLEAFASIGQRAPVVFPLHPRTQEQITRHGLEQLLDAPGLVVCKPLGYLDFVSLLGDAKLILTDSGGVQEEAALLGVSCLTLRQSTERPVTVASGTNRVVGTGKERVVEAAAAAFRASRQPPQIPELWDGRAGERIVERLRLDLRKSPEVMSAHA